MWKYLKENILAVRTRDTDTQIPELLRNSVRFRLHWSKPSSDPHMGEHMPQEKGGRDSGRIFPVFPGIRRAGSKGQIQQHVKSLPWCLCPAQLTLITEGQMMSKKIKGKQGRQTFDKREKAWNDKEEDQTCKNTTIIMNDINSPKILAWHQETKSNCNSLK